VPGWAPDLRQAMYWLGIQSNVADKAFAILADARRILLSAPLLIQLGDGGPIERFHEKIATFLNFSGTTY